MADGTAISFELPGLAPAVETRPRWWRFDPGEERDREGAAAPAPPLSADPFSLVLSPASAGAWGVSTRAWIAALAFFAGIVVALASFADRVKAPEPWPENPPSFAIIFEPSPPAEAIPPAPMPPIATAEALPPSEPLPAPEPPALPTPLDVATVPPPEPAAAPDPVVAETPPPPPVKPQRPRPPTRPQLAAVKPSPAPAIAAPSRLAGPQTAALTVPPVPRLAAPPRPVGGVTGNPKPPYPLQAAQRGWQGAVMLRVEVSAAGRATSAVVLASSGHAALDESARQTVLERWRFEPATDDGRPVAGIVNVPIQFRLED